MIAHGPRTLRSMWAPESSDPRDTMESIVVPRLPRESRTNLAGGELSCWLKIGQSLL